MSNIDPTMTRTAAVPDGYMRNSLGHLVPKESVKPLDLLRDDLVMQIVGKAIDLQLTMQNFKAEVQDDIAAFVQLSAEQYDCHLGGDKGNVTLSSYDGNYKILRANADSIVFDEKLLVAKELIDQCIHRWAADSGPEIRALIEQAFQTDKQGKISTGRVLSLTKLAFDDAQWQQAMTAIRDSITVAGSKSYFRIYQRTGRDGTWEPVALDLAVL